MPPNPPDNAHGFAMRSMSLRDMQIPKSEKKNSWPPLPNPGDAPGDCHLQLDFVTSVGTLILDLDLVFPHHV